MTHVKNLFLAVINNGNYDLSQLLQRIDDYHIADKLTDAEHEELIAAARGGATPGLDAGREIQMLWGAIHVLTARVAQLEGNVSEDDGGAVDGDSVAEYVPPTGAHDAYYAGDLVRYKGAVYECIAPEGVACVWSPDVMPGYWRAV